MARRDQPYLPLYIQDFMTDEKLAECSAKATGVYIRLMCILHKSDDYGKILLKQKDKQSDNQIKNFALKIAKQMPYNDDEIYTSLVELFDEKVIEIEGDFLIQKRMVKDNDLSLKRSESGSKGGKKSIKKFAQAKPKANSKAKHQANSENEIEYENDIVINNKSEFEKTFDEFEKFRIKIKKPLTDFAKKLILAKLEQMSDGNEQTKILILQQSITRGWQDVFPLKTQTTETVFTTRNKTYDKNWEPGK